MTSTSSRPLLAAKQQIPQVAQAAVEREHLLARIGGDGATRLTVVVAPAGWGKSILLAQWARRPPGSRRVAWVSLDPSDDEPGRFWAYLLSALGAVAPEVVRRARQALVAADVDPVDVVLPTLLNELAATADRLALVLDDYHVISDPRIHEQLEFLLSYLPPALHVVVAGRADPPLPLARLRARGELAELRAADLRLDAAEATALLASAGLDRLGADAIDVLVARTEGWAAGLHLAALMVREASDPRGRALAVRGDDRHLFDFFADEVLDRLTAEQRDLLVGCSVLDRLGGQLCDAVLGATGSAGVLVELERAGLFVTALDPQRAWFRCHPLFRDVLRRRLLTAEPDADRRLLVRAADWFLASGELEEAVRHRLAAGDQQEAADLLSTGARWFIDNGLPGVYFHLGGLLDPAVAQADPRLCAQMAYAAATSGHDDRVRWWLDGAGPLSADDPSPREGWRTVAGAAAAIRATVERAWTGGIEGALADAARAAELESDPALRGYAIVRFAQGRVLLGAGRPAEAAAVLTAVRRLPTLAQTTPVVQMQAAGATALALLRTGRHDEARAVCADVAAAAAAMERSWGDAAGPALTMLRTAEGQLAHLDGDVPAARVLLGRAAELARVWGHESSLVTALTAQAQAELDAGNRAAARALLNEAHDVVENGPVLPAAAEALRVAEARVGRRVVEAARRGQQVVIEELTDRERSILRALPGPLSQREIGAELFISMNTVKGYTKSLYRKLGVTGRREAVERAREVGLI